MKYLRLVLKVCEGCGALWLRVESNDVVYCKQCSPRLAAFPAVKGKRPGGRPRLQRTVGCCTGRRPAAGAK